VDSPSTVDKWARPVSTPIVGTSWAMRWQAFPFENASGAIASGIWLARWALVFISAGLHHGKNNW